MRFGLAFTLTALVAGFGHATTLTDTFGQAQNNCNYSATFPYSACDVIGDPQMYDIQKATFTLSPDKSLATILIYLNSGAVKTVNNQLVLGSFSDAGDTLIPGDIFFYNPLTVYDPSDPNTTQYLKYGIPTVNHGSFVAGNLYSVTGNVSTETAQQALGSSDYYRRNEAVLMVSSGSPTPESTGSVSVTSNGGDGTTSAKYVIEVDVTTTTALLNLVAGGQVGLLFSSADCGNDVIQTAPVPEPASGFLVLTGIGLLLVGRRWRARKG